MEEKMSGECCPLTDHSEPGELKAEEQRGWVK